MPISSNLTIVQKFIVSSLLVLSLGGVLLGVRLDGQIQRHAVEQASNQTAAFVDRVLRLQLKLIPSEFLTQDHIDRLRVFLTGRPLGEEVPVIKVWAPDGTVLFSSDDRLIGRKYAIRGGLDQALKGQVSSHLSSLEKSENTLEREKYRRLLEVYVPLRADSGRIVGAFEAYQTTDKLAAQLRSNRIELWTELVAIFLLLTGLLVILFRRDVGRPIRSLIGAAQRIGRGEYLESPQYASRDEIGQLAVAFKDMGVALRGREAELKKNNEELEENRKALDRQLSERVRELSAIDRLTAAIFAEPHLERIPQVAVELLGEALGAKCGAAFVDGKIYLTGECRLTRPQLERFRERMASEAIAGGQVCAIGDLEEDKRFSDLRELGREHGYRAMICVPVSGKDGALGAIFHCFPKPAKWRESILRFSLLIANQVGLALDNARLYRQLEESYTEQHRIASILQRSLLPAELPKIEGADVGAYYASATSGATVGGDFYDIFFLRDGRTAVVIGDVCGKGVEAAASTAMVKSLVRGLAMEGPTPSLVLGRLNNALEGQLKQGSFVTLLYGVYDSRSGEFQYASAGHVPPMTCRKEALPEGPGGIPLGIMRRRKYSERSIGLEVGQSMALVTDGLLEARCRGEQFGVTRCIAIMEKSSHREAQHVAELLYQECAGFADELTDDVAILVIKRAEAHAPSVELY